jgi:hypothetical protein
MKHAYVCCHLWNGSIKWHSPTWLSLNKYMACNPAILFKKITQNETIIHQPKYFAMKNVDLATKQEYISNVKITKKNRPAYPINWQIVGGNRTCSWCVGWSSMQGRFPGKCGRFGRLVSFPNEQIACFTWLQFTGGGGGWRREISRVLGGVRQRKRSWEPY